MMGFFDLNIPYHESDRHVTNKSSLKSGRLKLTLKAMEFGYTGVAYNRTIKGVMSESDRCSITLFPISKLIPSSSSYFATVKFHREILSVPVSSPFRQYTRLTVVADTPSQVSAVNAWNPILRSYDVVAVRPMNQNSFDEACEKSEVDIIAIDFSEKLPFRLKQPLVKAAIKRGVFFEITYSDFIVDVQSRRQIISSCKLLVDWTQGKNLIFSSAAPSVTELRGPLDVSNLFSLLGISTERARAAVSKNCRSVLAKALRKKYFYKEAVKVEEVPVVELVNSDENSFDAWLKWDPISSGEGDLLLEDIERSFGVCNTITNNVKSIQFTEDLNGFPATGLRINDLQGKMKQLLDAPKISKCLPKDLQIEKAVATENFEEHAKPSHLLDNQDSVSENQETAIAVSTVQGEAIHLSEGRTLVSGDKSEHHLKELPDVSNFMPVPMDLQIEKAVATENFEEHAKPSHLLDNQDSVSENQETAIAVSTVQGEAIHLSEGRTLVSGDESEHHLKELPDVNNFMPAPMETEAAEVKASNEQMDTDHFRDDQRELPAYQIATFLTEEHLNVPGLPEGNISSTVASSITHIQDTSEIHFKDALPDSGQLYRTSIEMPDSNNLVSVDFPVLLNKSCISTLPNFEILGEISQHRREDIAGNDVPNKVDSENEQGPFFASSGPCVQDISAEEERCSEMAETSFTLKDDLPMKGFLNPSIDSGKSLLHYEIGNQEKMESATILQGPVRTRAGRGKRKRYSPPLLFPFKRLLYTTSFKKSRK